MSNRIVSKKELSSWVLIYLGAIIFALIVGFLLATTGPAQASQKLPNKHVVFKTDTWSALRTWSAPDHVGPGFHLENVKDTVTTTYVFWPDGDGVNKIAIADVDVCYTLLDDGDLFQGVNANPYYLDDTSVINPGAIEVPRVSGQDHACNRYVVPVANRTWFRMDQDPAWFVRGKIRLKFSNDQDFDFKWGNSSTKYFHPGDDPEDGPWFYCECNYGGGKI